MSTTSGFTATSTTSEVIEGIDLAGRRAVVTGASSGVGVETARALASAGAEVTLAVRDTAVGQRVADEIRGAVNGDVQVAYLDLSDLVSVSTFATDWRGPLHILVNNAATMAIPETRTPQGWELQFAVNHLGHFSLATGLHAALAAADGARVVSVSSATHLFSPVLFDDPHFIERPYDPWLAYGQSKTANVLFAVDATRRWYDHGITVNAVMPGAVPTNLMRHIGHAEQESFGRHLQTLMGEGAPAPEMVIKTVEQGAATSVLVATWPALEGVGGRYFEDCAEAALARPGVLAGVSPYALDPEAAVRLWDLSEGLLS